MGTKIQISVLPRPKRSRCHQQYLPAAPWTKSRQAAAGRAASIPASPKPAAAACGRFCATCVPGAASHRLQGLPDRGTRLPGPHLPNPGHTRVSGPPAALPGTVSASRSPSSSRYRWPACSGSSARISRGDRARLRHRLDRRLLSADPLGRSAPRLSAAIAAACAVARPGMAGSAIPDGVWPIVASMFMFRMMIYLYELKHSKKPESLVDTLSYFFLLPNYCFMHFPVVDYRTMQRGYFADDVHTHAAPRAGHDVPRHDSPALLPPGLSRALDPGLERSRPREPRVPTSFATTCSIFRSRASFTWPPACFICSAFSFRKPIITICWRRASPITGGGSTSTGKIS